MSVKEDWKRPKQISREEEDLRWEYATHQISLNTFGRRYAKLKRRGLIRRSGKVLK